MSTRKVSFQASGGTLKGTLFLPESYSHPNSAVLFIHGWSSSESGYAKRAEPLAKLGYMCLTFDLLGHGSSSGSLETVTLEENISAVVAAYDLLASEKDVDKDAISIVGTSYGGYLASVLTSKRKAKSLVLRVPAIYKDESRSKSKSSTGLQLLDSSAKKEELSPRNNTALRAISEFKNKILLIEAEKDKIIPHETTDLIIKAAKPGKLTHVVIHGADHQFSRPEWQEEFIQLLIDWFSKQK